MMKDLCNLTNSKQDADQNLLVTQPNIGGVAVSETTKIKSFHRRGVRVVTHEQTTTHPVPDARQTDRGEVSDGSAAGGQGDQAPLWKRLTSINIDAEKAVQRGLPLVDRFRDTESAKAIDLLRTRLLHTLRAKGWRRVAIASPTAGCGATWMTVNLAQGLARVPNSRTIVMDINFRRPGVAQALELPADGDMASFLAGRLPAHRHLLRLTEGLAVGLNASSNVVGSEVLHNPTASRAIDAMVEDSRADVVLFDLPPVLEHDDLTAFLPQVDGVLLVADGTRTTAKDLAACEKVLAGHTQLLGVVLNKARSD